MEQFDLLDWAAASAACFWVLGIVAIAVLAIRFEREWNDDDDQF